MSETSLQGAPAMNNELNHLDDDLFTPVTEQERASLIGGGKTTQTTITSTISGTLTPTGYDTQADVEFDWSKDHTGLN
jgi:hypothetical protein